MEPNEISEIVHDALSSGNFTLNGVNPTVNINLVLGGYDVDNSEISDDEIIKHHDTFVFAKKVEQSLEDSPVAKASRSVMASDIQALCESVDLQIKHQAGPDLVSSLVRLSALCLALCQTIPSFNPDKQDEEEN